MRIKKTSQTTPVQAEVVNTYSESQENAYSCDYINDNFIIKGTTLYDNSSGSNATITLSDNISNYSYLEIYFVSAGNSSSIKVKTDDVGFSLNIYKYTNHYWFYSANYTISTNQLVLGTFCDGWIDANQSAIEHPSNQIKITKVIGY